MSKSVYAIVTERIVKLIETAIETGEPLPWKKPWSFNAARNYVTAHSYRGVNALLLPPGEYVTWSQICDLKKQNPAVGLKKGCKKELVVYFNYTAPKEEKEDGDQKQYPFLRYYYVYNINHVNGLEPHELANACHHEPIAVANQIMMDYVDRENIALEHIEGDKACYNPLSDRITLPKMDQFHGDVAEYYSTAFHEMVHSTGAKKRLNRNLSDIFGASDYSREELIAEMGASMLLGVCGIATNDTERNSAAYMRSWIRVLNDNVGMIVSAASRAQSAVDYIINAKIYS